MQYNERDIFSFEGDPSVSSRHVAAKAAQKLEAYLDVARQSDDHLLRDQQVTVMEDLHSFLSSFPEQPHGYVSLPTGIGKTVLFTEFVKATGLKTLILTPTKLLLNQTTHAFNKFSQPGDEVSVGKIYGDEKNQEDITITTYASFVKQTENPEGLIKPGMFELIILDEAHRALATHTKRTLRRYSSSVQLGFTATEDYSDKRKLSTILPHLVHKMSTKEAVESGLITPYRNVVVQTGVDASNIRVTATNEYDAKDLDNIINTQSRNQLAVDIYRSYFDGKKIIIFCNGVDHAEAVADLFNENGIAASSVHGGMSLHEQSEVKDRFHDNGVGAFHVLTNDRILTEGFDEPAVVAVMNLSPTLSPVRAKQRSGRALRLDGDQPDKVGYIVDFVDDNYRKPPLLFADPTVAELAAVGSIRESVFEDDLLKQHLEESHQVKIILDPESINEIAHEFSESRLRKYSYAPDGWLNIPQTLTLYNLTQVELASFVSIIKKRQHTLDDNLEHLDEHIAKFNLNYGSSHMKAKAEYYSPTVLKLIAELSDREFIDLDKGFPVGWKTWDERAKEHDPRALSSLRFYLNKFHHSKVLPNTVVFNEVEYTGPEVDRVFARYEIPSKDWTPITPLLVEYKKTEEELEDVYRKITDDYTSPTDLPMTWHVLDGEVTAHVTHVAYARIKTELDKMQASSVRRKKRHLSRSKPSTNKKMRARSISSIQEKHSNVDVYDVFGLMNAGQVNEKDVAERAIYNALTSRQLYAQYFDTIEEVEDE
jgi:superfamily II DNA or RNA helicase